MGEINRRVGVKIEAASILQMKAIEDAKEVNIVKA